MKKIIGYFVVFVFLAASSLGEAKDFYPKIFADINREAKKSVVMILGGAYLDSDTPYAVSAGAGFLIGKGLVLTAYHVVKAPEIAVITASEETFPAKVVASDPIFDVAVVKVEYGNNTSFLKLGDSSKIEEGEIVMVIGHPFDLGWSLSVGVISAIRGGELERQKGWAAIQTDAAVNPGNSGGPLLNLEGEVIGIIAKKKSDGIAFAVPINLAKEILKIFEKNNPVSSQAQKVSK